MNDAKHAPGPWVGEPGDSVIVVRSGQDEIATVGSVPYWKRYTETDAANAALIAVAPDLLAALQSCLQVIDYRMRSHPEIMGILAAQRAQHAARAAIAKATPPTNILKTTDAA